MGQTLSATRKTSAKRKLAASLIASPLGKPVRTKTIHSRVCGKTIELNKDPGVAEGPEVEVQLKAIAPPGKMGAGNHGVGRDHR